jgi:hypothetical protein
MTVHGLGRRRTPAPFVAACDRFIYLNLLSQEPQASAQRAPGDEEPTTPPPNLKRILSTAISSTSKDDGWSKLGEVGSYLIKSHAAFDPRDYGHTKLGELVRAEPYVEVKDVPGPTGPSQLRVRLKPSTAKSTRADERETEPRRRAASQQSIHRPAENQRRVQPLAFVAHCASDVTDLGPLETVRPADAVPMHRPRRGEPRGASAGRPRR